MLLLLALLALFCFVAVKSTCQIAEHATNAFFCMEVIAMEIQ